MKITRNIVFGVFVFLHYILWLVALPETQIQPPVSSRLQLQSNNYYVTSDTSMENIATVHFPRLSGSLKRVKREWVIPPLYFPENDRGPFPKYMVKLWVHAIHAHDGNKAEEPMELIIHVIDLNDNRPEFTPSSFYGKVSESAKAGDSVMRVTATDGDDPETDHAMLKYRILSQTPDVPSDYIFDINPLSGVVSLTEGGLDRETHSEYKLIIQAADMNGEGLSTTCTAVVTITDSNDNAPQFLIKAASASVPENEAGVEVFRFQVTDEDELGSANTYTKYTIVKGNEGANFKIITGQDKMEGILSTAKKLDFESTSAYTLLVVVTNEAPFTQPVSTSTATISVKVEDKNEPPMFSPSKIQVVLSEDAQIGSSVTYLRAVDPDTARQTKIKFKLNTDVAGWFNLDQDTGRVSVRSDMDRESHFVRDNKYAVLVLAYDNDTAPATGTGTLLVTLLDVNDNAPVIRQRKVSLCSVDPVPVQLDIVDSDSAGRGNAGPFTVELQGEHHKSWNIMTNSSSQAIFLSPKHRMPPGWSSILLRVYDAGLLFQDSSLDMEVCQCEEAMTTCTMSHSEPLHHRLSYVSFVLGVIFGLLLLLLLLILRRRKKHTEKVAFLKDLSRDNIFCYDEEGGGEEDRDFDQSLLRRDLNEHQVVVCTEVVPVNQDIGQFLTENLVAADSDMSAPPYDSLLVFDYEGAGSQVDCLSSLDSSDSELDQDFGGLQDWGPRFSRLADMYAAGLQDDTDVLPGKTEWV